MTSWCLALTPLRAACENVVSQQDGNLSGGCFVKRAGTGPEGGDMVARRLRLATGISIVVLMGAALAPAIGTAQTSTTQQDTVTVTAVGKVEGRPDRAVVQLAIRARASSAQQAMDQLARRQNAVIEALEDGLGLADEQVRTGNVTLRRNCRYDRSIDRQVCTGYVAATSIQAETRNLEQVGAIIDAALAAGANALHGVSFERTENDAALKEALAQAMDLARSKAEALAASEGRDLGRVIVIEEGGAQRPIFESGAGFASAGRVAADLVVDPPDDITRVVVVATYSLN